MNTAIVGLVVNSRQYGNGIITKEEYGLIWVDFPSAQKKDICFLATSAFSKDYPFLTSDDPKVDEYIQQRITIEKLMIAKKRAVESLQMLKIDDKYIQAFVDENKIYIIHGKQMIDVNESENEKVQKAIEWYTKHNNVLVYAVMPIPNKYAEGIFTYALLYVSKQRRSELEEKISIKGNLGCTYAYYLNPNASECGEGRPLGFQIADSGVWALPIELGGFVQRVIL